MTTIQLLFTLGLGTTWLLVVFPMVVQRDTTVHGSAAGFERAMSVLRQDPPHMTMTTTPVRSSDHAMVGIDDVDAATRTRPTSMHTARRPASAQAQVARLRQVFVGSLVAVAATATAAVMWQGAFWTVFVVTALATGGFVAVLRHRKLESDRARAVIRSIRRDAHPGVGRDRSPDVGGSLPPALAVTADEHPFGHAHEFVPTGNVEVH